MATVIGYGSIIQRIRQATDKVLSREDIRQTFEKNNGLIFKTKNADEVQKAICAERDLLQRLTKKIGIQPK